MIEEYAPIVYHVPMAKGIKTIVLIINNYNNYDNNAVYHKELLSLLLPIEGLVIETLSNY